MATAAPSANRPAHTPAPARVGVLRWLVGMLPTALVLGALVAAGFWGHVTGWDFTGRKSGGSHTAAAADDRPRPVVRFESAGSGAASDLPLPGRNARVEFGSAAEVERAGIGITPVWPTSLTEQVTAAGEVQFDPS